MCLVCVRSNLGDRGQGRVQIRAAIPDQRICAGQAYGRTDQTGEPFIPDRDHLLSGECERGRGAEASIGQGHRPGL